LYYLEKAKQKNILENIHKSLDRSGVLILSVVVSGKNNYGDYFTYEQIMAQLNEYFRVLYAFPLIPKSTILSKIVKMVSFANTKLSTGIEHILYYNILLKHINQVLS